MKSQDREPLEFPIGGKTYTVGPVGIDAGVELSRYLDMNPAQIRKAKLEDNKLFELAMGDVWEQMRADGAPLDLAWRAGMAALAHFRMLLLTGDPQVALASAEALWESNADPESLAATMAARLQKDKPATKSAASTRSPSSAAASKTRTPASSSGTRSRSTTPRRARPKK